MATVAQPLRLVCFSSMAKANPLHDVVDTFVDRVTEKLELVTAEMATVDRTRFRHDVANEAYAICRAMIDSDGRHSDDELWPVIMTFAPLLDDATLARATPATLRDTDILNGRAAFFDRPSDLFEILLAGDRRAPSNASSTYYTAAMDIVHTMAALDVIATEQELEAIARFRDVMVRRIHDANLRPAAGEPPATGPRLGTEATPLGPPPTGLGPAPSSQGPGAIAAPATAAAGDAVPPSPPAEPARPLEELLEELDDLIGLAHVKAEIRRVADLLRVAQLREEHGLPQTKRSNHLIFAGNPGTGKTTVARLVAQIYRTLEVVKSGHLIEVDRSGLVAGFVGQTAPLVASQFDRAEQGILFIDEAYSLVRGGANDFGKEAIDAIVKNVEDRRASVVVIMAGYTEEMNDLMDTNPGLRSRFPKTIFFPDYSTTELVAIFETTMAKDEFVLADAAKSKLATIIDAVPRDRHFGNGRLVRNIYEDAVVRQASRIVTIDKPTTEQLSTLEAPDIPDRAPGHAPEVAESDTAEPVNALGSQA